MLPELGYFLNPGKPVAFLNHLPNDHATEGEPLGLVFLLLSETPGLVTRGLRGVQKERGGPGGEGPACM